MAEALNWVSRISTLGAMMVLPMIGGRWLDGKLGTTYWSPIGLVVGLAVGTWQIANIAAAANRRNASNKNAVKKSQPTDSESQS